MPKLSKRVVDALKRDPEGGEFFVWCDELPGFGVRVKPSGRKTFLIQYRMAGRTRRLTLGAVGVLTVTQARKKAIGHLAVVAQGGDPSRDRNAARLAPTVRELGKRYIEDYARPHKKASTAKADERNIELHVLPRLAKARVADVTRQEIADLHRHLRDRPILANRVLALLSKMFSLSVLWGLREDNPVKGVPRYRENRRERFLSEREFARLGQALREAEIENVELPGAIAAIRLLLFTGCRCSEILRLRWDDIDFQRGLFWLRDSKTGARTVPMNAPARAVLSAHRETVGEAEWVIEGLREGRPLSSLWRAWDRIRTKAELEGVRIHDLRHSHASVGAEAGLSLPIIGALLGHTSPATTARYAHLADDPRRRASDLVGSKLAAALGEGTEAEVVSIRGER